MNDLILQASKEGIHRYVVAAVISNGRGKVLLLKRPKEDFLGGIYELPSGKVEAGESLKDALLREVKEETGLIVTEILNYLGHFDYLSKSKKLTRQFNFLVRVKDLSKITLKEHSNYIWISKKEINEYNITEQVKRILMKFWNLKKLK